MSPRLLRLAASPDAPFPPARAALREPNGLLAVGGDLSPQRLLRAYAQGIFPWFNEGEAILWWSPDPRVVFDTATFSLPARFRRTLRASGWQLRADTDFAGVMRACALAPRPGQEGGTWIGPSMLAAYAELHRLGHAHSVEAYSGERLVGGIYGVAIGRMFFGESMFSGESGGSKAALAGLVRFLAARGCPLLDAQVENPHLLSLGARLMDRDDFLARVGELAAEPARIGAWTSGFGLLQAADLAS
jgi:leucyl/phenylalanyl-tRNA--protein transferase